MSPEDLLQFWTAEIDAPKAWFKTDPAVDQAIRERFEPMIAPAAQGAYDSWLETPRGALALVILLDQFPRNAYRGEARAFAFDGAALRVADEALRRGYDLQTPDKLRSFFYLPLEHSEDLHNQKRCCALIEGRLGHRRNDVFHAQAHRRVIERFGRFPHRNAVLGRESTPEEEAFLAEGGYNPAK